MGDRRSSAANLFAAGPGSYDFIVMPFPPKPRTRPQSNKGRLANTGREPHLAVRL